MVVPPSLLSTYGGISFGLGRVATREGQRRRWQWRGKDGRVAVREGRRGSGKRENDIFMVYY